MDPAFELAPTPGLRASLPAVLSSVILWGSAIVGGVAIYSIVSQVATGELIWPIPSVVWTGVLVLTAALALRMIARVLLRRADGPMADNAGRAKRSGIDAFVGAPLVLLIGISAAARLSVQVAGFAGLHPTATMLPFTVVGSMHDRSHSNDYYRLRLQYGDHGRTFSDLVDEATYEAAHDGDTVQLPVETGRFGLQRAMIATRLTPADLHHPG